MLVITQYECLSKWYQSFSYSLEINFDNLSQPQHVHKHIAIFFKMSFLESFLLRMVLSDHFLVSFALNFHKRILNLQLTIVLIFLLLLFFITLESCWTEIDHPEIQKCLQSLQKFYLVWIKHFTSNTCILLECCPPLNIQTKSAI